MTAAPQDLDVTAAALAALIVDRGLLRPEMLFGDDSILITTPDRTEVQDWADALGLSVLPGDTAMGAWRGWAVGVHVGAVVR